MNADLQLDLYIIKIAIILIKTYEAELGRNILIFKIYIYYLYTI